MGLNQGRLQHIKILYSTCIGGVASIVRIFSQSNRVKDLRTCSTHFTVLRTLLLQNKRSHIHNVPYFCTILLLMWLVTVLVHIIHVSKNAQIWRLHHCSFNYMLNLNEQCTIKHPCSNSASLCHKFNFCCLLSFA